MRGKIDSWRRQGLNDAADNLERYLQGKGGIVPLSRDEARKFKHVREREIENTRRFLEKTFLATGTKSESALKLVDMKDGDHLELTDGWDYKFTRRQAVYNYLLGDANLALAFGENNVKSIGKFAARRDGDTITIDGAMRHVWKEPYNFERGQPGSVEGHTLERHGKPSLIGQLHNGNNPYALSSRLRTANYRWTGFSRVRYET
jgi:hypothetical protein